MIHPLKKIFVHTLITAFMFTGLAQTAQAAMMSTEQVVTADAAQAQPRQSRRRLLARRRAGPNCRRWA